MFIYSCYSLKCQQHQMCFLNYSESNVYVEHPKNMRPLCFNCDLVLEVIITQFSIFVEERNSQFKQHAQEPFHSFTPTLDCTLRCNLVDELNVVKIANIYQ